VAPFDREAALKRAVKALRLGRVDTAIDAAQLRLAHVYDPASAREAIGASGRALAVFGELDADVPGYRDVSRRLERPSRVQARG
jgi:hypothetical protein